MITNFFHTSLRAFRALSSSRFASTRPSAGFSTSPSQPTIPPQPSTFIAGIAYLVRFGAAAYVIQVYVCNTTLTIGPSMQPTLNSRGDILFTEYLTPRFNRLKPGDVVVATKPTDPSVTILKRIRAMPGETVWVHPSESAVPVRVTIPADHVWLEGDNTHQSTDSRHYGPVPLALIRGRARVRFWPPGQAKVLHSVVIDHTEEARRGIKYE